MIAELLPHEDPTIGRWSDIQAEQQSGKDTTRALQRSFVRVFATNDGEDVLDYLRRVALDRELPPTCSGRELRHLEGQRALVRHILNMIERGKAE